MSLGRVPTAPPLVRCELLTLARAGKRYGKQGRGFQNLDFYWADLSASFFPLSVSHFFLPPFPPVNWTRMCPAEGWQNKQGFELDLSQRSTRVDVSRLWDSHALLPSAFGTGSHCCVGHPRSWGKLQPANLRQQSMIARGSTRGREAAHVQWPNP